MGKMPPAFLAAIARKNDKKGPGKSHGKSKLATKSKMPMDAEDKLDGGIDEATESGTSPTTAKAKGGMPAGLAAYMAKNHPKK